LNFALPERSEQEKINDRLLIFLRIADILDAGSYLPFLHSLPTISLKATSEVNFGIIVAGILMGAPVFGFIAARAARSQA
jgi:hypothetical protein